MNAKNIQEYVITKILENFEEKDKEIEALKKELKEKDKQIKEMKHLLKDNQICYNCVCSKCERKIPKGDNTHSHNTEPQYPTLCYRCFFHVL